MLVLVSFLFGSTTFAQPLVAEPTGKRTHLRAAIFGLSPWGMLKSGRPIGTAPLQEGDQLIGVMPDMVRAVSQTIGEPVEMVPVSYARMYSLLTTGEVDFAFFFQSDDSKKIAKSLVKIYTARSVLVAKPETVAATNGSLEGLLISSPRSVRYETSFDSKSSIKRIYTNDFKQGISLLSKGRVDAVAGPEIGLLYNFLGKGLNPSDFAVLYEISTNEAYLQYSYKSPLLYKMEKVAEAARKHTKDGTFQALIDRYLNTGVSAFIPFQANDYASVTP